MINKAPEKVDSRKNIAPKTSGQHDMAYRDELLEKYAPDDAFDENGFNKNAIKGYRHICGKTVYSFQGVEFLEILAPVIASVIKKDKYIITSQINFRKIVPC